MRKTVSRDRLSVNRVLSIFSGRAVLISVAGCCCGAYARERHGSYFTTPHTTHFRTSPVLCHRGKRWIPASAGMTTLRNL